MLLHITFRFPSLAWDNRALRARRRQPIRTAGVREGRTSAIRRYHPAVIAEFEAALIRQRTREGMTLARSRGRLRGKPPSLAPAQDREIRRMHDSGDYPIAEIAGIFKVSRPTIYRALQRTTPGSANLPLTPAPAWTDTISSGPPGSPQASRHHPAADLDTGGNPSASDTSAMLAVPIDAGPAETAAAVERVFDQ